jgi:hypothetical protein
MRSIWADPAEMRPKLQIVDAGPWKDGSLALFMREHAGEEVSISFGGPGWAQELTAEPMICRVLGDSPPAPGSSLRRMLRFRHGVSAWDGELDGERVSMFTSAPRW